MGLLGPVRCYIYIYTYIFPTFYVGFPPLLPLRIAREGNGKCSRNEGTNEGVAKKDRKDKKEGNGHHLTTPLSPSIYVSSLSCS